MRWSERRLSWSGTGWRLTCQKRSHVSPMVCAFMPSGMYTGAPISCPSFSCASTTILGHALRSNSVQVFLGDYIDRGPNSRQVIDLLIARRRQRDVLFLKGNHEDCVLRFLTDPTVLSEWQNMGGLNTLLSYGVMGHSRR